MELLDTLPWTSVGTKEEKQDPVPDEADMSLQKVLTALPSSGLEGRGF